MISLVNWKNAWLNLGMNPPPVLETGQPDLLPGCISYGGVLTSDSKAPPGGPNNCPAADWPPPGVDWYWHDESCCIALGDCRDVLPLLPKVDLVLTDPPYNIGYHYEGYSDNLTVDDYQNLLRAVLPLPCCVIHYAEALCALAWTLEELPKKIVAWVYSGNTARQWRGVAWFGCEPDFTLDGQDYKNPSDKRISERIANGERARLYDWWEVDQVKNVGAEKTEHPCQIPLAVMQRILRITPSATILDPFMGSGTTLRAAKDLGRKAIGIEISEEYAKIAIERLRQQVLITA